MADLRPEDREEWDDLIEAVLGPEWLNEDPIDQLAAVIKSHGRPGARAKLREVLDQ